MEKLQDSTSDPNQAQTPDQNHHRKFNKVFVLDTNIILDAATNLFNISQDGTNLIVLPETVIDELDNKKSGYDEINFQAREFGRILSDSKVLNVRQSGSSKNTTVISIETQGILIDIISLKNYSLENVERSIINDRKIIKVAQFASKYYRHTGSVIFLSNDIMCRTRAISLGVKTEGLLNNKQDLKFNFIKVLENFDSSLFPEMENSCIKDYDQDYKIENYCYHFKCSDGNTKIAYIVDGKINFIHDDDFDFCPIKPINLGQRFAMAGMTDPRCDVCLIEAIAGSGKTLLAVSAGIGMVKKGEYDKIIYIRNSVESVDKAEEVGFLPGLESKFAIYNYPLYDTLEFIVQSELKKSQSSQNSQSKTSAPNKSQEYVQGEIEELKMKYNIDVVWPGAIRGRTLSKSYVIVDEIQNFSKSSLLTTISRMDKDCKVVCIGSNRQIDHQYINKYTNGLSVLIKSAKEDNSEINIFGTELNKVVRGKITEWAERIFEKK